MLLIKLFNYKGVACLVDKYDDVLDADLFSKCDVLARLRHDTVSSSHHQDGALHLVAPGDHVLLTHTGNVMTQVAA